LLYLLRTLLHRAPRSTLFPYTTLFRSCFPELDAPAKAKMVRGAIISCGLSITETAMGLWGRHDKMRNRYNISGLEHIEKARAERSEEHTSELQSRENLVCRLLLEKKKT